MQQNGAVAVTAGCFYIKICHVVDLQLPFSGAHLLPLRITPLVRVYLSESLHGQEEHQLKGGYLAADGLAFQRLEKSFPVRHKRVAPFVISFSSGYLLSSMGFKLEYRIFSFYFSSLGERTVSLR